MKPHVELEDLLAKVRELAIVYYRITGKPLGVTGELAEYEASKRLGVELCVAREPGCDAVRNVDGAVQRIQIKGRWSNKKHNPGARVSKIDLTKSWDSVILVLFDRLYEPLAMYEAPRDKVTAVLERPGSKSRQERGQMSISQFKAIARRIWPEGGAPVLDHGAKSSRPHRPVRFKRTGVVYPTMYQAGKALGPELLPGYAGKPSVIWFALARDHGHLFERQNAAGAWVALDDPSLE